MYSGLIALSTADKFSILADWQRTYNKQNTGLLQQNYSRTLRAVNVSGLLLIDGMVLYFYYY